MIDPSVSVPIAKPTSPAAVAAAGPADEPLELRSMFHGLCVLPPNHTPPCASEPIESFATSTAPASRSRSTIVASRSSTWFSYGFAPHVVLMPLVAKRSLTPKGIPWSGPRYRPAARSLSAFAACASASSSVSVTTHLSVSPCFFRRSRYILVSATEVTRRSRTRGASAVTGWNARSSRFDVTLTTGAETRRVFARGPAAGGRLPGRYGRKVMAGSVSSGMSSFRSAS